MERVVTTIPLGLVIEILSWLPARSLLRFRRVCKLWLSITNSSTPISIAAANLAPLPSSSSFPTKTEITVVDDDPKRTPDRLLILPRFPDHRPRSPHCSLIMSSQCNGLVCISDGNGYIELLNPTTGERYTPPPHHTRAHAIFLPYLGFHPETKEYKVVVFCFCCEELRMECEVYTLGTNSWRQIPYPHNCLPRYQVANANGALYWQININGHNDRGDDVLVSFDLKNESFTRISFPDFARVYPENRYKIRGVVELQGTLCLLVYPNSLKRTDIWMMALSSNDDTTTHQWALKYSVSCFIAAPLFIHNERILVSYSDCHRPKSKGKEEPPPLVYHYLDCKDGCTTQVYREGKPESRQDGSKYEEIYRNTGIDSSQPFAHVESLVSLRNQ